MSEVNRVDVILDFKRQSAKHKNMGRTQEAILVYGVKKQMLKAQDLITDADFTAREVSELLGFWENSGTYRDMEKLGYLETTRYEKRESGQPQRFFSLTEYGARVGISLCMRPEPRKGGVA